MENRPSPLKAAIVLAVLFIAVVAVADILATLISMGNERLHILVEGGFAALIYLPILFVLVRRWHDQDEEETAAEREPLITYSRFLRDVFDSIPHPLYVIDLRDNSVAIANSAANRLAMPWTGRFSLFDEHDSTMDSGAESDADIIATAVRMKESVTLNLRRMDKNGQQRYYEVSAMPIMNEGGVPVSVMVYGKDITEQALAERKLSDQLTFMQEIIDTIPNPIFTKDVSLRYMTVNAAFEKMFNVPRGAAAGKTPMDVLGDTGFGETATLMDRELLAKPGVQIYSANVPVGGESRTMMFHKATFGVKDGVPDGIVGVMVDVTESEQIQQDLADSEEMFRAITGSAQDAIVVMDTEGRITYWNEAAERTFGYGRTDAIGRNLHYLLTPAHVRPRFEKGLKEFIQSGTGGIVGMRIETEAIKSDASLIPVEVSVSSVKIKGEWHAVGIIRDITDRRTMETALQRAKDAAVEANRTKSLFLANMSHEIRTPMNGIIGMAQLLLDGTLPDEERQYAELLKQSADSLLTLLNDLLDFSKLEAGRMTVESVNFQPVSVVEEASKMLAVQAQRKGVDLIVSADPRVPELMQGDPHKLKQVLVNLLSNAIKFTEVGSVEIRVSHTGRTVRGASLGERIAVISYTVTDTGVGIPVDKIEAIFESFTQADGSHTRRFGGTGLGLSISHRLVELMGGTITVSSEVGTGSTFAVTLPALVIEEDEAAIPGGTAEDMANRRVLVCSDNQRELASLKETLSMWKFRVDIADSVDEAASALGETPDIALIDAPFAGRIPAEAFGDVPVLILNTVERLAASGRGLSCNFKGAVSKPPTRSELLNAVMTTLVGTGSVNTRKVTEAIGRADVRLKVLVAEDSYVNQQLIRTLIDKRGHFCAVVDNGEDALKALASQPFDLVLMDVQMPVMNGIEAVERIKKDTTGRLPKDIPVIAITAHAMSGDRERLMQAGMDDYIAKPLHVPTVMQQLARWEEKIGGRTADGGGEIPPAEQESADVVVDRVRALALLGGDEELYATVLDAFMKDGARQFGELNRAARAGDLAGAERLAHSLKAAAGAIGARRLSDGAKACELSSRAGQTERLVLLLKDVEREFDAVMNHLEAAVKRD